MTDMTKDLEQRIERLREASELYRKNEADNEGRDGARASIAAVLNFLRASGVKSKMVVPLQAVLGALEDAEKGAPNRLTMPEKTHRQPTKKEALNLAIAAAAVTFLMRSGKTAMLAAQQVKTWVPTLNRTPKQIKTFRANLINDGYSPEIGELYQSMLDEADDWPPEHAAKLVAELLREKLTK